MLIIPFERSVIPPKKNLLITINYKNIFNFIRLVLPVAIAMLIAIGAVKLHKLDLNLLCNIYSYIIYLYL